MCVYTSALQMHTLFSIAHLRTTTSLPAIANEWEPLGERQASPLSREFVCKRATPGRRLSLFDIVWPL